MKDHRGYLGGAWAFERMFSDATPPPLYEGTSYRAGTGIPSELPTYAEAEVQVFEPISPACIRAVWIDRTDLTMPVRADLDRLPGPQREIFVQEYLPRFSNNFDSWG